MTTQDSLDQLLKFIIEICATEVQSIQASQPLKKSDADKLIEYGKFIVLVKKDWRIDEKEKIQDVKELSNEELNAAILAEAEKLKGQL